MAQHRCSCDFWAVTKPGRSIPRLCLAIALALLGGWAAGSGVIMLAMNDLTRLGARMDEHPGRLPYLLPPLTVVSAGLQPYWAFGISVGCALSVLALRRWEDKHCGSRGMR